MIDVSPAEVQFLVRVRTGAGDVAECDHPGFAGFPPAARVSQSLAAELAGCYDPHLGPRALAGGTLETLGCLGADPLGCVVEVWHARRREVWHEESVAGYAALAGSVTV